jgi:hypothetical protein
MDREEVRIYLVPFKEVWYCTFGSLIKKMSVGATFFLLNDTFIKIQLFGLRWYMKFYAKVCSKPS